MNDRVFIIDLARCTGCGACLIACRDRAGVADDADLLRIESAEAGTFPNPTVTHRIVHCFHCARGPCIAACPAGALTRTDDGFAALNREACDGCGKCARVCPFDAIVTPPEEPALKCDGCTDELAEGREPTCVRACPMRALGFARPHPLPAGRVPALDDWGAESGPRVLYLSRG